MILRTHIECPACQEPIILRVGVTRARQSFTVACPSCESAIRGETIEKEDGLPRFHLPEVQVIEPKNVSGEWRVVTTYGDLPNFPNSGEYSAFLSAHKIFGDENFPGFLNFLATARWLGEKVDPLEHAYGFYLKQKWDLLDRLMRKNFERAWPENPSFLDRHTAMHRFIFPYLVSLDPEGLYPQTKYEVWSRIFKNEAAFSECAHSVISNPEFEAMNRRVAEQFFNLLRANAEWLPALAIIHLRAKGRPVPTGWQVPVGRIDSLRDAYRQNFEVSCQILPLIIRMQNISERRDPESIKDPNDPNGWAPRILRAQDRVNNVNQYTKSRAATKEAYLNRHPRLRHYWNSSFSRDVRNSIAHAEFDYVMHDGIIAYKGREVPYYVFIEALIRQITLLAFWLDLCKLYKIYGSRWDFQNRVFLGLS